jgi:hypothetical protein
VLEREHYSDKAWEAHVIGGSSIAAGLAYGLSIVAVLGLEIICPIATIGIILGGSSLGGLIGGLVGHGATADMNRRQARRLAEDDMIRRRAREGYVPA